MVSSRKKKRIHTFNLIVVSQGWRNKKIKKYLEWSVECLKTTRIEFSMRFRLTELHFLFQLKRIVTKDNCINFR